MPKIFQYRAMTPVHVNFNPVFAAAACGRAGDLLSLHVSRTSPAPKSVRIGVHCRGGALEARSRHAQPWASLSAAPQQVLQATSAYCRNRKSTRSGDGITAA